MDYIKLKKRNVLKFGIMDENNKPKLDKNGHEVFIEFDLEDINTIDNYSKCIYLAEKAGNTLKGKVSAIKKREDNKKDGDFLSKNEKDEYEALKEYYKDLEQAMDLFLGQGGTSKIFGKSRYYEMFDDLSEMLEPIMPKLKINADELADKIKTKYSFTEDANVLKDE